MVQLTQYKKMCYINEDEVMCFKDALKNAFLIYSILFQRNLSNVIYNRALDFVHLATVFLGLDSRCSI